MSKWHHHRFFSRRSSRTARRLADAIRARSLRFERLEARQLLSASPAGAEFQVNTYTTGDQGVAQVASDQAGDFVVVWESADQDGSGFGIFGQRYNSSGAKQGAEFQVNTYTTFGQSLPSVAMDSAGDFVIAWQSPNDGGGGTSGLYGIFAQRYNSAGVAQGGEFQVNTYTTGPQENARVAMDSAGDFVITWTSMQDGGSGSFGTYGIYAQRYNSSGVAQGGEFQVNTYTTSEQFKPAIAMDSAGDFVITWESNGQDGDNYGIYAQRYNSSGTAQGGEFRVNTYTTGAQLFPTAAMDSAGDFVIAWASHNQDGENDGVFAQRYNSSGTAQGSEFQVNTYTTDAQTNPAAAMDSAGDFVIAWESNGQDGTGEGVFAQSYSAGGAKQGGEFQVNTYTNNDQENPAVAMDSGGDFVVAWSSTQDGSSEGVYAQRYTGGSAALTITGHTGDNITLTFTSATAFTVNINGTVNSYSTTTTPSVVYNGPVGSFSKFVFEDLLDPATVTQSLSTTSITIGGFQAQLNNAANLYAYLGGGTGTVNLAAGTDANFYVGVDTTTSTTGYSYLGDPATGTYSEISGVPTETVTGSGGTTYAYYYSAAGGTFVGNPGGTSTYTSAANGNKTTTFSNFPQLYVVGPSVGTDTATLNSLGGSFVATPNFSYVETGGLLVAALYTAQVTAVAAGAADTATFYSYAHNTFNGTPGTSSSLTGSTTNVEGADASFTVTANSYVNVSVFESGSATDTANLTSPGNGSYVGNSTATKLTIFTTGASITVNTFYVPSGGAITAVPAVVQVTGHHDGTDQALLTDDTGLNNALTAAGSTATLKVLSGGIQIGSVTVNQFGSVTVNKTGSGGNTVHKDAIDFTLTTVGNWTSN